MNCPTCGTQRATPTPPPQQPRHRAWRYHDMNREKKTAASQHDSARCEARSNNRRGVRLFPEGKQSLETALQLGGVAKCEATAEEQRSNSRRGVGLFLEGKQSLETDHTSAAMRSKRNGVGAGVLAAAAGGGAAAAAWAWS